MKVAYYTKYGSPEVVSLRKIPKPTPQKSEVLVQVHATTVNRTDCGVRSAEYFISRLFYGLFKPKFNVLGNEFAGIIEEVGSEVSQFSIGDRVFGYDDKSFAAHAEYKIMQETEPITKMPINLDYVDCAPIAEGAHYALCDLRAAHIRKGQNVLIYGATGAIGSAAVQLAKYFGAQVAAVCHGQHIELVRNLGADTVFDYTRDDFTKMNQLYDLIFDAVGKVSFGKCKPVLRKSGIYISTELGKHGENVYLSMLTNFYGTKKVLFPIPDICKEDLEFLKQLVIDKKFKPLIDREYSLDQIVDAYKYVDTAQKLGNVVITVPQ